MNFSESSKLFQFPAESSLPHNSSEEKPEGYLTHPTLGLLYSVCHLSENVELFTTIYAKRLFFLVSINGTSIKWETIGRQQARLLMEKHLSEIRKLGQSQEYDKLIVRYQQTFR